MLKQSVSLKQGNRTVDEYAAEFIRLSRFAPRLVEDEEDKGNQFKEGLRPEIGKLIASRELEIYSQVHTAARKVEIEIEEDESQDEEPQKDKGQQKPTKRPFEPVVEEVPRLQLEEPPVKRQLPLPTPTIICGFCKNRGTTGTTAEWRRDCV